MTSEFKYEAFLPVGIIQTTVNAELAWQKKGKVPQMTSAQDAHAWQEICKALRAFKDKDGDLAPKVVVLPELSLPRTRLDDFEKLVGGLNIIAFVGVDYRLVRTKNKNKVYNDGIVFIPNNFWKSRPSRNCTRVVFGKTYAAPREEEKLKELIPSWEYCGDDKVYIFDMEQYGLIGVSICYDFMDIERALMYRGKVHHLFVLAYNRDLEMFRSLADSLSRTVYCNVVVCNTGIYGGSVAVAPYRAAYNRTIYSHDGKGLFTTQVVKLPVRGVEYARSGKGETIKLKGEVENVFKDPPPGVFHKKHLS